MAYLLANRIFMFFPIHFCVNYFVALRVAWHHPGICWGVMTLNQRIPPLGACVTITQSSAFASFYSLTCWVKSVFSHPTLPHFVFSVVLLVVVMQLRFWVPSPLLGQEKFCYCSMWIDNHFKTIILLKRLWAFVHSH